MPLTTAQYDVIVIGAGQGGGPLAGAFAKAGRRVLVIEKEHVGGTCINEGCTPTKTMVASARVAYLARRAADYGVKAGAVTVDLARVRERKRAIVAAFRAGSEKALERSGAELRRGHASFVAPRIVEIRGAEAPTRASGDVVVINTGQRPAWPSIPGLDDVDALDSTSIMELGAVPAHLVVLGGGYVGLEFAQMFRRFGSHVTLLHRGDQVLPREDTDVATALADILRQDGVDLRLQVETTSVAHIDEGLRVSLRARPSGETSVVDGSHLLVATGRTPNTSDLGAEAAGVELDQHGYVKTNAKLETTAPGIYAVGDVKGGPAFTHVSYDDFRVLRTNLLHGGTASIDGRLLPYTVFTDPPLGRIGMGEREAREAGRDVRVARLPMTSVARAAETDETRGFMKAVVDAATDRILGAAVLGAEGGELASAIQIAMMGNLPYGALRDGVFSHPTFAESLNNLFGALDAR